ncbi:hypothetical protein ACFVYP_38285 [Kitasatospora sp. NPDC058201]|uniref:hypothetical protein n=1 Tax=unclassified Kitasatospora TaxID=2633591 RepID=UPI00365832DC
MSARRLTGGRALAAVAVLWAAAGHPHTVVPMTYDDLLKLTGGTPSAVVPEERRVL